MRSAAKEHGKSVSTPHASSANPTLTHLRRSNGLELRARPPLASASRQPALAAELFKRLWPRRGTVAKSSREGSVALRACEPGPAPPSGPHPRQGLRGAVHGSAGALGPNGSQHGPNGPNTPRVVVQRTS